MPEINKTKIQIFRIPDSAKLYQIYRSRKLKTTKCINLSSCHFLVEVSYALLSGG